MLDSHTEGASRVLRRAERWAQSRRAVCLEPIDLLAALAEEVDGRAAALLIEFGADLALLIERLGLTLPADDADRESAVFLPLSADYRAALAEAAVLAKTFDRNQEIGTEHLLAALLTAPGPISEQLEQTGLNIDALMGNLQRTEAVWSTPIPLAEEIGTLQLTEPGEAANLGRILDASGNRAREGLRVVEDYVRFALDDPGLTRRLKEVRHRLTEALKGLDPDWLTTARDTPGDVGTHIMTAAEQARENPRAVLIANFKRTSEALRSLEEYAKLVDVWLAGRFEILRYDVYVLEKLVLAACNAHRVLGDARLYVLVGHQPTLGDLTWLVEEALAGGAQVIQLREKHLPDREWLSRAREVRILTARAGARFVVNDRPDLALLAGADGVHLGQHDLTVRDARRVLGPRALIGLSTHDAGQLDAAILSGASYLGVGPVFRSRTKDFAVDDLAGLSYVRRAAETTNLPWFAIGGITEENLDDVLEAGATRIAVSAAVTEAEFPRQATARLRARLERLAID